MVGGRVGSDFEVELDSSSGFGDGLFEGLIATGVFEPFA